MGRNSDIHHQLDAAECRGLADALGDTPETVISVHLLRRGLCRAYVAGDPSCFRAAIVQSDFSPDEPAAFGSDAQALWDVLRRVPAWGCVSVSRECAPGLGEIIRVHMSAPWRRRGLARAAASIVAARVQQAGQLPVWSTGDFNTASLSLARRLGFTEVSRSTYVVLGDSASVTETSRRGVPMA